MLVGLGILLIVAGAVLGFAVDAAVDNVDLVAVGWILMGGGALALVIAALRGASWMSMSNRRYTHERHVSDDGQHVVEESRVA